MKYKKLQNANIPQFKEFCDRNRYFDLMNMLFVEHPKHLLMADKLWWEILKKSILDNYSILSGGPTTFISLSIKIWAISFGVGSWSNPDMVTKNSSIFPAG